MTTAIFAFAALAALLYALFDRAFGISTGRERQRQRGLARRAGFADGRRDPERPMRRDWYACDVDAYDAGFADGVIDREDS